MMSADALDLYGNPVAMESFSFQPETVLKEVPKPEYVLFMIYTLEYKSLMLDQLAHEREQALLSQPQRQQQQQQQQYGIVVQSTILRDLAGFGVAHVGSDGQTVMKWILEIAADNYPELLFKSHMINTPWIFNSIWWLVKNILDPNTIKKISITGTDYMKVLLKDIPVNAIPVDIGGKFVPREELFRFNTSPSGPFHYPNCESEVNCSARREHRMRVNSSTPVQNPSPNSNPHQRLTNASPQAQSLPSSVKRSSSAMTTTTTTSSSSGKSSSASTSSDRSPDTFMLSTASSEIVLMNALGSRNVRVSHLLKMGDPSRLRTGDLHVDSFVEGRKRRARDRERNAPQEIQRSELAGMLPQRSCKNNCVIQ
jgi:hypothetical protein